jgi:O-antigen/teichoic acid export membrane protein
MSKAGRVVRNTFYLLLAQVATAVIGIATSIFAARYLGANGLGIIGLALALTAILGVLVDFGLGTLTTREVARDRTLATMYLTNVVTMRLFLTVAFIALIVFLVNFLGYAPQTIYVTYIIAVSVVLNAFSGTIAAVFQAFQELQYVAAGSVVTSLAQLFSITGAIVLHIGVVGFAFVYVIANAITLVYFYGAYVRRFRLQGRGVDWTFSKNALKEAWPMAALAISVIIYFRIDVVILSLFKGAAEIGLYTVAYTMSEATTIIPTMFMASLFPLVSQMHEDSKHAFADTCAKSMKYMLYIGLPMAFTITLWAKPIVALFYGSAFSGSAVALQILIWSAAAMYVGIILGSTFVSANLQKLSMKLTIGAVVFNVALNMLVIPQYGYWGASATTVATEIFLVCLGIFFLERAGYPLMARRMVVPSFFGLATSSVISAVLLRYGVHPVLITAIALAVYATIIYKLGLDEEDKRLIMSLIKYPRPARSET